jgi:hypothetical protein
LATTGDVAATMSPIHPGVAPGGHVVIGCGVGAGPARRLAAATGRTLVLVDNAGDVPGLLTASLGSAVVSAGPDVRTAQVTAIGAGAVAAGVPLGFVYGWAGERVALAHVSKIASGRPSQKESALVWSAFPALPSHDGIEFRLRVLPADTEDLVSELAAGHRLIAIETHGNGVDAPLTPGVQLCARAALGERRPTGFSLPCMHGGPCIRVSHEQAEAGFVGPHEVRADVLLWSTCWGLLAADAPFAPVTSLAAAFAAGPDVGGLLTTCTSVAASPEKLLTAAALLLEGTAVGELANRLNGIDPASPWVVLGDPLLRAFPARPLPAARAGAPPQPAQLPPGLSWLSLGGDRIGQVVTVSTAEPRVVGPRSRPSLVPAFDRPGFLALNRSRAALSYVSATTPLDAVPAWHELSERAGQASRFAFLLAFTRWVRNGLAHSNRPDSMRLEQLAESTQVEAERWASWPHPAQALSGAGERTARLLAHELDRRRDLTCATGAYFLAFLTAASGVLSHTYSPHAIMDTPGPTGCCPYCGSATEMDRYRLPSVADTRIAVRCQACTNIADMPPGWAAVSLAGPAEVAAGTTIDYRLTLTADRARQVCHVAAGIGVQPVPFPVTAPPAVDLMAGDTARDFTQTLRLRLLPGTPVGVYFLVAVGVADLDVLSARRPIAVRDAHADDHDEQRPM